MNNQQNNRTKVKSHWRPDHASAKCNAIMDRRLQGKQKDTGVKANQAAVKLAAEEKVTVKWQWGWDILQIGGNLRQYHSELKLRTISFRDTMNQRFFLQLQNGYCELENYLHFIVT